MPQFSTRYGLYSETEIDYYYKLFPSELGLVNGQRWAGDNFFNQSNEGRRATYQDLGLIADGEDFYFSGASPLNPSTIVFWVNSIYPQTPIFQLGIFSNTIAFCPGGFLIEQNGYREEFVTTPTEIKRYFYTEGSQAHLLENEAVLLSVNSSNLSRNISRFFQARFSDSSKNKNFLGTLKKFAILEGLASIDLVNKVLNG